MKSKVVAALALACLGLALAAPMPRRTAQWYLASQVFQATAATPVACPAVLDQGTAQRVCAATALPEDRFLRLSQVILYEYLGRRTLVPLSDWLEREGVLERRFLLQGSGWTLSYRSGGRGRGPRRNLIVVTYFPWRLTSPLLTPP